MTRSFSQRVTRHLVHFPLLVQIFCAFRHIITAICTPPPPPPSTYRMKREIGQRVLALEKQVIKKKKEKRKSMARLCVVNIL